MSVMRILEHGKIRNALVELMKPLKESRRIKHVFKTDQKISELTKHLPCVCVYFEDGEADYETMDESKGMLIRGNLTIKVKCQVYDIEKGDDEIDELADLVAQRLNSDLQLGDLLRDPIEINEFFYDSDESDAYKVLVFSAEIEFYDKPK